MEDLVRQSLYCHACHFREAIVRSVVPQEGLATLRAFPRGACADASLLLAKYLEVKGWGLSSFVLGERQGQRHAWLQLLDFTIDITADQFEDQESAVIVSNDSSWHAGFNGCLNNVADFCLYAPASAYALTTAYKAITACIECGGRGGAKVLKRRPPRTVPMPNISW